MFFRPFLILLSTNKSAHSQFEGWCYFEYYIMMNALFLELLLDGSSTLYVQPVEHHMVLLCSTLLKGTKNRMSFAYTPAFVLLLFSRSQSKPLWVSRIISHWNSLQHKSTAPPPYHTLIPRFCRLYKIISIPCFDLHFHCCDPMLFLFFPICINPSQSIMISSLFNHCTTMFPFIRGLAHFQHPCSSNITSNCNIVLIKISNLELLICPER